MTLTVVADPGTGMLMECRQAFEDGAEAYRQFPEDFRPLREGTRGWGTPDGCTVGENVAYLTPGEFIVWADELTIIG